MESIYLIMQLRLSKIVSEFSGPNLFMYLDGKKRASYLSLMLIPTYDEHVLKGNRFYLPFE